MKKRSFCFFLLPFVLLIIAVSFHADVSSARKVICVDVDPNDNGFLSNHEGWERQNMRPGDIIIVGGNLTNCLNQVMNGDTLIIICHGRNNGEGFRWGGMNYTGFGNGPGQMPVPPNFGQRMNVVVRFCACWSARDPDGKGPNMPLTDKLRGTMGPPTNGNSVGGFVDRAWAGNCVQYLYDTTATDTATINNFLRNGNGSWQRCPPDNRNPPVNPNQRHCLQVLLDSVKGGPGRVEVVDIIYKAPENRNSIANLIVDDCNTDENCGCTSVEPLAIPMVEKVLDIRVIVQGFWNPTANMMVSDTVQVNIRSSTPPFEILESHDTYLNQFGAATLLYFSPAIVNSVPYYIQVVHRNSIDTWNNTSMFTGNYQLFDFRPSASQAFGNNQIQVDIAPVAFGIFGGDVNKDGTVDASDLSDIDNDAANFVAGYVQTDLTGDDFVDATDYSLADNNAANFVSVIEP